MSSNLLKYLRLKRRDEEDKLCARGFVPPPALLTAVFQEYIPVDEVEKYRKLYKKIAES